MKKTRIALLSWMVLLALCMYGGTQHAHAQQDATGYIRVETGEAHVIALKADGTVWAWGSNMFGALGDGTQRSRYVPARVDGLDGVIDIAAGRGFSVALRSDGTVWGWGSNIVGQLGFDRETRMLVLAATELEGLSGIVAINVKDTVFRALDGEGNAYENCVDAVKTSFHYKKSSKEYEVYATGRGGMSLAIDKNGSVWYNGGELAEFKGARDVAVFGGMSGEEGGYVVLSNGTIAAIGTNRYGQLGNGFTSTAKIPQKVEGISDVKDISALHNIYVLHNDGTVSTMYNRNTESRFQKVPIDDVREITQTVDTVVALKNDGTVWTWPLTYNSPDPEPPEPVKVEELADIVAISATQNTIFAFGQSGALFAKTDWVRSGEVIETQGDYSKSFFRVMNASDVKNGYGDYDHLILLTTDDRLLLAYMEGPRRDIMRGLQAVDIGGTVKKVEVMMTYLSIPIALREDGVLCAVFSEDGEDSCETIPGLPPIADISANFHSVLALDFDGTVWQLGAEGGNLGEDDNAEYEMPYRIPGLNNIRTIAAGKDYYFAVNAAGELYAWGENGDNQLLQSDYYTNYRTWQPVKESVIHMTLGSTELSVNNHVITIPAAPIAVSGTTLVPIREIAENLGGTVDWEAPGTVTVRMGNDILILWVGSDQAQYNGVSETLAIAPVVMDGKTFLPLRYVCERLGADVLWEGTANRITIVK